MTEPRIRIVVKPPNVIRVTRPTSKILRIQQTPQTILRVQQKPQPIIRVEKIPNKVMRVNAGGPQGRPGNSGSGLTFTQLVPSTEWTINHNLGFRPNIAAQSVGGLEMIGEVLHLSSNVAKITFTIAVAGTARLV